VKAALVRVDGFEQADISLADKSAQVTYDPARCSPEDLVAAINDNTSFTASTKS